MNGNAQVTCGERIAIGYYRVHAGLIDHDGEVLGRQVRRTDNQPAGNTVKFDRRQCGGELIANCH